MNVSIAVLEILQGPRCNQDQTSCEVSRPMDNYYDLERPWCCVFLDKGYACVGLKRAKSLFEISFPKTNRQEEQTSVSYRQACVRACIGVKSQQFCEGLSRKSISRISTKNEGSSHRNPNSGFSDTYSGASTAVRATRFIHGR